MEPIGKTAKAIQEQLLQQAEAVRPDPTSQSSECIVCGGTGYVRVLTGVARCECQKERIINSKLAEIPERYRDASFANYVPMDSRQQVAYEQISAEFTGSYFLWGDYARGKTHLATAQYIKLIEIERLCLFLSMAELITELRRAELDPDYFCLVRHRVRYSDRFHLFVDDVDKFKVTDFKFEVLFDLFDTVWKRKLGLTVTSNYSLAELGRGETLHPAIVRRIDDICAALEV